MKELTYQDIETLQYVLKEFISITGFKYNKLENKLIKLRAEKEKAKCG